MDVIPSITELLGILRKAHCTSEPDKSTNTNTLTILFDAHSVPEREKIERYHSSCGGSIDVHVNEIGEVISISISQVDHGLEADYVSEKLIGQ